MIQLEASGLLLLCKLNTLGALKLFLEYKTDNGEVKNTILQDSFKNMRDIKELNAIMTAENNKNKWNKAVFTVNPEGKFDMQFIWDQELQDEIEKLAKE